MADSSLAYADDEVSRLRGQLAAAWGEVRELRRTVAHQARLLENLAPETHPAAPSLNCVYWLFSLAHEHERSWKEHRNRLLPSLRGLGTMPAPDITPTAWARHLASRRHEEQRGGGTPCDHVLNIELGRLKTLLEWAVETQMITFNPLRSGKYIKTVSRRDTELRQPDVTRLLEEAALLRDRRKEDYDDDGSRAAMLKALILCWFDSMMRFNEARTIRRDLIQKDGSYQIPRDSTKSDAGARAVVLTPRTLEAIAAIPAHPATNYVFVHPGKGTIIGEQTIRYWWRWCCDHGNLDARASKRDRRLTPHHLRHAGATQADAAGASTGALMAAMGHTNTKHLERYIHRDKNLAARHVAEIMASAAPIRRGPTRARRGTPERRK